MKRRLQTFRVSFSITDFYTREIRATSAEAAIDKARKLYDQQYEDAFEFDIEHGGLNDDWYAEEVPS